MPEAVSSNSIPLSKIHPASLIDILHDMSNGLQAYKAMLENLIEKADRQTDQIKKIACESRINPENIKELRDKLIAEQLRQGLSAEQISQMMNIRLTAIKRIMEPSSAEADEAKEQGKAGTAG